MYKNPKNIKQEIKLMFFYLIDFAIVFITVFIGSKLFSVFKVPAEMKIFSYVFLFGLGTWLSLRTRTHPVDRNIYMILYWLKRDRNKYLDITPVKYQRKILKGVNQWEIKK